ncbi:uncharacterized protein LOC129752527 [Uranotaenia lowii]|uniref:uncharacterized protein LOC129752527 n=1 Tax=Uranotaenia lowii TaxID=190385 RepID=UPI002478D962|nr:uncharacterized protein LOC129752527 [Uranotaenia lowii]
MATATATLTRILANNSGIRSSQRRIISSVVSSILRYGGVAWNSGLNIQCNQQKLNSVQRRMNVRVISAYRTVSLEAACVVAGVMRISVLFVEEFYYHKNSGTQNVRIRARESSMANKQQLWNSSERGRWTHRLIPNIKEMES